MGDGGARTVSERLTLSVPDMDCPSCARKIEASLERLEGLGSVDLLVGSGTAVVEYNPAVTSETAIRDRIEAAGYVIEDADDATGSPHRVWTSRRAVKTWAGAAFLLVGIGLEFGVPGANPVLFSYLGSPVSLASAAFVAAAGVAGGAVVRNGWASLRARSLDVDLLMSAGIVAALAVNLPFEAATLAVLFSIAELLERFSMDRARSSLRALVALSPDTATVRIDGEERVLPVEAVEVGATVIVRPGEKVPVDGVVRHGSTAVDESPVTGESVPAEKTPGDDVYAGSINESGYVEVEATAAAEESTLARVIELVEDAERGRTRRERFIDRFAAVYTPVVFAAAIVTVPASMAVFDLAFAEAFVRGLTLLVIACPCAFVISTPVSVVSAVTSAARNGVLIKGGDRLEAVGEVAAVAFDKTGTLTTGELEVTDVVALGGASEADVLARARALEVRSEHPIGQAIVAHADERGVADRGVRDFEALPGRGVRGTIDGHRHHLGKPAVFEALGFDLEHAHVATDGGVAARAEPCEHGAYLDLAREVVPRLEAAGKTVVLVGTNDHLVGVIAIADTVRPGAADAIERLRALGVEHVVMLTGDNERTALAIADRVGIEEVSAGLLPEEKVEAIEALDERYGGVAMVGDGVNDAPALAAATVGIAMGAAGTDTAIETADVALLGDDLASLPYLFRLSRSTVRVVRQNVWSSLGVKLALAVGAPLGVVSVMTAIVVGDMGMSLGVTANAMRLAGLSPRG